MFMQQAGIISTMFDNKFAWSAISMFYCLAGNVQWSSNDWKQFG